MCKIAVIGLGGVGGYIGAALANVYEDVTFVVRGARRESIQKKGLVLHSDVLGELTVYPKQVVEHIQEAGPQDYIFVCVKNYSLDEVCLDMEEIVTEDTVIIPVMNGVDPGDRIREHIDKGMVLDSVIYILANANPDFSITQSSQVMHIHMGVANAGAKEWDVLKRVEKLMQDAKLDCVAEKDVAQTIWKKYALNCAFNVLTAYYEAVTEEIRSVPKRLEEYGTLLQEAVDVALAKGVNMPETYWEEQFVRFRDKQVGSATSSLCRDVMARKNCELETFSGYLVREAKRLGVSVPLSERLYKELKARVESWN